MAAHNIVSVLSVLCLLSPYVNADLLVGAFNIQIFGVSKMGEPEVMDILTKTVRRYDLVLVQEIRDISETTIPGFLEMLNEDGSTYEVIYSDRLGRTSSKEQYAYYYRSDKITVNGTFQYDDSPNDVFEREPYAVKFNAPGSVVREFALIGVHTSPDDADIETDALVDVYEQAKIHWDGFENFMILGDLNADCSYIGTNDWPDVRLRTDDRFTWLIADEVDTTVFDTDCAYDRIVLAGESMNEGIVEDSATIFRYDTAYSLDQDAAKEVSDHYPVEVTLKGTGDDDDDNRATSNTHGLSLFLIIASCTAPNMI